MEFASVLPVFGNFGFTILAFVVSLSVIVFVHEFGHYIVGRWSGIKADVFSLGFGPVLASRVDRHGTKWQFALLPFGGYVKFKGDKSAASTPDGDVLETLDPSELRDTMHGAPLWARAATVAAGPVFNFIFSIALFFTLSLSEGSVKMPLSVGKIYDLPHMGALQVGDTLLSVDGIEAPQSDDVGQFFSDIRQSTTFPLMPYRVERDGVVMTVDGPSMDPARVDRLIPRSAAIEAGLEIGDVITAVNQEKIYSFSRLKELVEGSNGAPLTITIWRNGQEFETILQPKRSDEQNPDGSFVTFWRIGIVGTVYSFEPANGSISFSDAFDFSLSNTYRIMEGSVSGLYHVFSGAISSCNLSGPIGIAETTGQMAQQSGLDLLWFIAMLSTAIGMVNLFPIPVLDGGHLLFYAYEAVFRKPPNAKFMNGLMSAGLMLILSFMLFAIFNDIFCP